MRFAIEVEGKAVGSIGFGSEGDVERVTAEVGYWIGEKYWGHGIMSKVLEDITEYAFQNFHYEKLYTIVFSTNPASMHVSKSGVSTGSCFASCCSQEWSFGRFLLFL